MFVMILVSSGPVFPSRSLAESLAGCLSNQGIAAFPNASFSASSVSSLGGSAVILVSNLNEMVRIVLLSRSGNDIWYQFLCNVFIIFRLSFDNGLNSCFNWLCLMKLTDQNG